MWAQGLIRYLYVSLRSYASEAVEAGVKGDSKQYSEAGSMPVRVTVLTWELGRAEVGSRKGGIDTDRC